jgi:hypothetical protein
MAESGGTRVSRKWVPGRACNWDTKTCERLAPVALHRCRLAHMALGGGASYWIQQDIAATFSGYQPLRVLPNRAWARSAYRPDLLTAPGILISSLNRAPPEALPLP